MPSQPTKGGRGLTAIDVLDFFLVKRFLGFISSKQSNVFTRFRVKRVR